VQHKARFCSLSGSLYTPAAESEVLMCECENLLMITVTKTLSQTEMIETRDAPVLETTENHS